MTRNSRLFLALASLAVGAGALPAQVVVTPSTPQIGSSNAVTAEPRVPRPTTTPCIVPLITNYGFDNFTPDIFPYAPPSQCPGPWSKVVFTGDFTYGGSSYDRTAAFYIGHANIYYGTTPEEGSWHVERDVTDLSAILRSPQSGEANLASPGTTIWASAALEFYPADQNNPAPVVPDIVVPVGGGGTYDDAGTLNTSADSISQTMNLPQNVKAVYADVIAQNQSNDEFFYLCLPNDLAGDSLAGCGNTAFRETEVSLDGNLAGFAPAYPWIFTGGMNPYNWIPIPANQTLTFKPYRVNLTPFAATLDDGKAHTIAISEYNADDYFLATANVLVYLDHGSRKVTGNLVENTLTPLVAPTVVENVTTDPTGMIINGPVTVTASRAFTIRGFVNTSEGHFDTTVQQNMNFSSTNTLNYNLNTYDPLEQDVQQTTTVDSTTTTAHEDTVQVSNEHLAYPLTVDFSENGGYLLAATVDQQYLRTTSDSLTTQSGAPIGVPFTTSTSEETKSASTLNLETYALTAASSQNYTYTNSRGGCYNETLTSSGTVLTGVIDGCTSGSATVSADQSTAGQGQGHHLPGSGFHFRGHDVQW